MDMGELLANASGLSGVVMGGMGCPGGGGEGGKALKAKAISGGSGCAAMQNQWFWRLGWIAKKFDCRIKGFRFICSCAN
jgi:hypothetical protein